MLASCWLHNIDSGCTHRIVGFPFSNLQFCCMTLQVHFGALCLMATTFWCFLDNSKLHVDGNWRKLWDIRIPQKVKVFLWRAARGCLQTRHCLQSRGVKCDDRCFFCERSYENDWHLFFGCDETKSVWEEAELWHIISANLERAGGFVALFFQLLEELLYHQISTFTMTLWGIWKRRNNKMWNGAKTSARMTVRMARESLEQWQHARLNTGCRNHPMLAETKTINSENIRWQTPAVLQSGNVS